jgi:hypothetical protein
MRKPKWLAGESFGVKTGAVTLALQRKMV